MQRQWVELVGWSGGEAKESSVIFRLLPQSSFKVPPKSNVSKENINIYKRMQKKILVSWMMAVKLPLVFLTPLTGSFLLLVDSPQVF